MNGKPITTKRHRKTLAQRLANQEAELKTCTTPAMVKCVLDAIADTTRQIQEARS